MPVVVDSSVAVATTVAASSTEVETIGLGVVFLPGVVTTIVASFAGVVATGNTIIRPTPSARARDLRGVFDTEMAMVDHVNTVFRAVGHRIRIIGRILCYPCPETCKLIVHVSVIHC